MTHAGRRGGLALGLLALLAAFILTVTAAAQEPERFDETVREFFFAGFAGNEDALARGMAICEETLAADPDHPGALVWQAAGWHVPIRHGLPAGRLGHGAGTASTGASPNSTAPSRSRRTAWRR